MDEAGVGTQQVEALQAKILAHISDGHWDGLVQDCFTPDARLHGFRFRAHGPEAIRALYARYGQRLADLGPRQIIDLHVAEDFIWQEIEVDGPDAPIVIYEFKFIRDDKVYLQLVGEKQGAIWQAADFADFAAPDVSQAERLHHRYIDYQARQDHDGMADDFFSADARLVTAKLRLEGREALRTFFAEKFVHERDFRLVSMGNLTGDHDYVWFEATAASSAGARTVYDVMLLHDDKVRLQLVGTLDGTLPANRAA